jgi:hypothetical protein
MSALLWTDPPLLGGGSALFPWIGIGLLGLWHGVNPAMGWLLAAALGLQEGGARRAWRALPPLAMGHALAVAAAVLLAMALGLVIPPHVLKWIVGGIMAGYGGLLLLRRRHPRFGGMRMSGRDLIVWSFLMAGAHGAGLMVLPFVMDVPAPARGEAGADLPDAASSPWTVPADGHAHHLAAVTGPGAPDAARKGALAGASLLPPEAALVAAAVAVHTGVYLLATGLLAMLVVKWWGLSLLRSLWVDLDRIWAVALILTGILTPLL